MSVIKKEKNPKIKQNFENQTICNTMSETAQVVSHC